MNIFKRFKRVEEKISFLCKKEYHRSIEILRENLKKELEEIETKHKYELKRYESRKIWADLHFQADLDKLVRQHGK